MGENLAIIEALQCTLSIILHFNSINFPSSHNKYPIEIYTISKYYWKILLLRKWISEASRDRASSLHLKRGRRLQIFRGRHLCAKTNMVDKLKLIVGDGRYEYKYYKPHLLLCFPLYYILEIRGDSCLNPDRIHPCIILNM